jgi:hypothetical protein
MEGHLEALLEMDFCTKPPNFGVEANMEAPTGDALREPNRSNREEDVASMFHNFLLLTYHVE